MLDPSPTPGGAPATGPSPRSKPWARFSLALLGVGAVLWNIVRTELRVADLRNRGFGDVVVASVRDHAYFPLIGAMVGGALSMALVFGVKRLLRG